MDTQGLQNFLDLARTRRSARDFLPDPVPVEVIDQLLEAARWAPSGYNLQPVHFVVVTDPDRRQALRKAGMNQRQVSEAPAVVVFVADRHVAKHHTERMLAMEVQSGAADDTYRALMRKFIGLAFTTGPVGLNWLWKALLAPPMRRFVSIPNMPAVHRRYWLGKQVGLSGMNLLLAAHAAGLASCPMEGFDTRRVAKALNLPRGREPMLMVPIGYPARTDLKKTRLPLAELIHREKWGKEV